APRCGAAARDEAVRQVGGSDLAEETARPGPVRRPLPLLQQSRPAPLLGTAAGHVPLAAPRLLRLPLGPRPLRPARGAPRALSLRLLPDDHRPRALRDDGRRALLLLPDHPLL